MLWSSSTRGWMCCRAPGTVASSTSNRPMSPSGRACQSVAWATALKRPESRFAPARLWIGCIPAARRMCDSSLVVVVLPLVPETTMLPFGSERVTSRSACGARRGTTWPAMTVPPPRPRRRLSPAAARPASSAALSRGRIRWPSHCGKTAALQFRVLPRVPRSRAEFRMMPITMMWVPSMPREIIENWCASCVYPRDCYGR